MTAFRNRRWPAWILGGLVVAGGLAAAAYFGIRELPGRKDIVDDVVGRAEQTPTPPPPSEKLEAAPGPDNSIKSLPTRPTP